MNTCLQPVHDAVGLQVKRAQPGFTRIELCAVLSIVFIVAIFQWTAGAHSRRNSHLARCTDNFRHLMNAWRMYVDDHAGGLPKPASVASGTKAWVYGMLDYTSNQANTNEQYLIGPQYALTGQYLDSSRYFRCPDDTSSVVMAGPRYMPRVRSVSMNAWLGEAGAGNWGAAYKIMRKAEDISQPARTLAILEENPESINDGAFYIAMDSSPASLRIVDFPGAYHDGGMNAGLADGHVEFWFWRDARTIPPPGSPPSVITTPNNVDVMRLQSVASYIP